MRSSSSATTSTSRERRRRAADASASTPEAATDLAVVPREVPPLPLGPGPARRARCAPVRPRLGRPRVRQQLRPADAARVTRNGPPPPTGPGSSTSRSWRIDGDRIHRRRRWGDLVDLSLLDTRQYRDPQVRGHRRPRHRRSDRPSTARRARSTRRSDDPGRCAAELVPRRPRRRPRPTTCPLEARGQPGDDLARSASSTWTSPRCAALVPDLPEHAGFYAQPRRLVGLHVGARRGHRAPARRTDLERRVPDRRHPLVLAVEGAAGLRRAVQPDGRPGVRLRVGELPGVRLRRRPGRSGWPTAHRPAAPRSSATSTWSVAASDWSSAHPRR